MVVGNVRYWLLKSVKVGNFTIGTNIQNLIYHGKVNGYHERIKKRLAKTIIKSYD